MLVWMNDDEYLIILYTKMLSIEVDLDKTPFYKIVNNMLLREIFL